MEQKGIRSEHGIQLFRSQVNLPSEGSMTWVPITSNRLSTLVAGEPQHALRKCADSHTKYITCF